MWQMKLRKHITNHSNGFYACVQVNKKGIMFPPLWRSHISIDKSLTTNGKHTVLGIGSYGPEIQCHYFIMINIWMKRLGDCIIAIYALCPSTTTQHSTKALSPVWYPWRGESTSHACKLCHSANWMFLWQPGPFLLPTSVQVYNSACPAQINLPILDISRGALRSKDCRAHSGGCRQPDGTWECPSGAFTKPPPRPNSPHEYPQDSLC